MAKSLLSSNTGPRRGIQAHPLSASIVTSAVGSEAFNEQLSGMTQLGYPMIVIPSMLMMMAVVH